jgi:hypothetical protein
MVDSKVVLSFDTESVPEVGINSTPNFPFPTLALGPEPGALLAST